MVSAQGRLCIPAVLAVAILGDAGCSGSTVRAAADSATDAPVADGVAADSLATSDVPRDVHPGDVIALEGGVVCDPPVVIPDAGTSCGMCYGPGGAPSGCALCPVGPDGGLVPLC